MKKTHPNGQMPAMPREDGLVRKHSTKKIKKVQRSKQDTANVVQRRTGDVNAKEIHPRFVMFHPRELKVCLQDKG